MAENRVDIFVHDDTSGGGGGSSTKSASEKGKTADKSTSKDMTSQILKDMASGKGILGTLKGLAKVSAVANVITAVFPILKAGMNFIMGLLKRSKIFSAFMNSFLTILGAFVDVLLIPLIPFLTKVLTILVGWLQAFQKGGWSGLFKQIMVDITTYVFLPLWNWIKGMFTWDKFSGILLGVFSWDKISSLLGKIFNWDNIKSLFGFFSWDNIKSLLSPIFNWENIKTIFSFFSWDNIKSFLSSIISWKNILSFLDTIFIGFKLFDFLLEKLIGCSLSDVLKWLIKPLTNDFWKDIFSGAKSFFENIKSVWDSSIGSVIGNLTPWAEGTPYVPRDMPAFVHQGERIITAKENTPALGALLRSGITNNSNANAYTTNNFYNNFSYSGPSSFIAGKNMGSGFSSVVTDLSRRGF